MASSDLLHDLGLLSGDPWSFVLWAFPWGEEGTELAEARGPEAWQEAVLKAVRDGLLDLSSAIQIAVASGHGVGKSSLVAWLILWAISTFEDTRGVVTANTENQLKQKTWAELAKWFRLFAGREFFRLTATAIFSVDAEHEKTWRIDLVPWSERSVEAFAGLHNKGKRILVVFDEGSGIPDVIYETTEGALTDSGTQIIWFVAGNPTRNTGRFRDFFGALKHRWQTFQVDSREVSITKKEQFEKWIADYGEDSDFVRVRVRGIFPRAGAMEFIGLADVDAAAERSVSDEPNRDPLVIGVDVARFGDDASVIFFRRGRDARTVPPIVLRGVDTQTLAGRVAEAFIAQRADAVFVDGGGVGGGVVDRLRVLRVPVFDIQFGSKSDRPGVDATLYANKRAEMWGSMREWLRGGCIEADDRDLRDELIGPQYGFNARNEIQLERKEDMKRRGLSSPDRADALALTFAYPVVPQGLLARMGQLALPVPSEYEPLQMMEAF